MSGVGLSTNSPEDVVGHPVRRRIVFWLMLVGSGGIVTAIASLVLSFRGGTADARLIKGGILAGALFAIWANTLVLYGRTSRIAELDRRGFGSGGDEAHARASAEEREVERQQA